MAEFLAARRLQTQQELRYAEGVAVSPRLMAKLGSEAQRNAEQKMVQKWRGSQLHIAPWCPCYDCYGVLMLVLLICLLRVIFERFPNV